MFLINLFNFRKSCNHEKVSLDMEQGYCPDCGKLIANDWYITRCACCGVRLKSMTRNGEVVPQSSYCVNCGGQDYIVEKLKKVDFINVNYAVLVKRCVESVIRPTVTQCWQEKSIEPPKLTMLFR